MQSQHNDVRGTSQACYVADKQNRTKLIESVSFTILLVESLIGYDFLVASF